MAEINGVRVPFIPAVRDDYQVPAKIKESGNSFESVFSRELEKLKFSKHAASRLEARNIELNEAEMTRLESAVKSAETKGAKDSLVMMDKTAFIVNIPNRTIVTAVNVNETDDKVFTNIDSVVFS
jgi:flagellar operon protein